MIPFDMCYQTRSKIKEKKSMIIVYYLLNDIFHWLKGHQINSENSGASHITQNQYAKERNNPAAVEQRKKIQMEFFKLKTKKNCNDLITKIIEDNTKEEYVTLGKIYSETSLQIVDHTSSEKMKSYPKMVRNVQRLVLWYGFFKQEEEFLELMKLFHISPFANSSNGRSTVHMLCLENHYDFLELVLKAKYSFFKN
jgi:hypothetical protein